jgi:cell volume regulation protein A
MESGTFLLLLGFLLVLAFVAEEGFRWLKIPPVLVLMGCGFVLGPVTHLLPPRRFLEVAPAFGALTFLLILFEGGLDLRIRAVLDRFVPGALLAVTGFSVAGAAAAGVGLVGGLPWPSAAILGIVLAPISGAIVLPLVAQLGLRPEVRTLLVLEGAFADVLGVLTMAFAGQVLTGGGLAGLIALGSLLAAAVSVVVAVAVGLVWPRLTRALADRRFIHVLTFGVALTLWGAAELTGASGALAVLCFGVTLANEDEILKLLHLGAPQAREFARTVVAREHHFIAQLTFLVRSFFFVFLGVVVGFRDLPRSLFVEGLAVLALFTASRWAVVRVFERRGVVALDGVERRTVWMMQPRGLVSAVLAIEAARLSIPGSDAFLGFASLVIIGSNLLMAIGLPQQPAGAGRAAPALRNVAGADTL